MVPEAVFSPSSRQWRAHCWMRARFLAPRPTVHCIFRWGKVREFSGVSFVRALSPSMRTRYQITTQVPSHWWVGFNAWIAGWVGPHALWMDLLSISLHNFTTSYIDYSENISSLSCGLLPNVDPFRYRISNTTFINISTNIIWEVFKYCDTIKLMMLDTRF